MPRANPKRKRVPRMSVRDLLIVPDGIETDTVVRDFEPLKNVSDKERADFRKELGLIRRTRKPKRKQHKSR